MEYYWKSTQKEKERDTNVSPKGKDTGVSSLAGSVELANTPDSKQQGGYNDEFEAFWQQYDKRSANKKKAFQQWTKLCQKDRHKATVVLPDYLAHQPDAQYRKDPERWLRDRAFENEYSSATTGLKPIGQRTFVV
ncbi:hypothetical protein ACAW74_16415 [Fibrella sp. WM1]|uniref:hypothetical protein n=1 Tax=Fibrella musci TaxID=3242485 RepID=UPI003520520A